MARPETRLQREIRKFLALHGFRSVAVPNGAVLSGNGKQRAIQMNSLKRDGLCVGFPDLLVYGEGRKIGHIEVKTKGGKQSDTQVECERWLKAMGHDYAVCRSLEDVRETLGEWGWVQ